MIAAIYSEVYFLGAIEASHSHMQAKETQTPIFGLFGVSLNEY